ncbi:MAG: peptidase M28, partial [Rikenellaceae bacterium]|nr:peptidase M28 [Rikenellaceae bacterium]
MKRILFACVALCCMTATAVAQKNATQKIIEMGRTDNQVMEHLDVLCNRIGGRVIGSNAYDNAVEWVAAKFKEWGLEVEVQEAGTLPVGFNRGPWFGRVLGEKNMQLHFATPAYTVGTKGVQRGHVLLEPMSQGEFDLMKSRLKGAWVLVNGTSNGFAIDRS